MEPAPQPHANAAPAARVREAAKAAEEKILAMLK